MCLLGNSGELEAYYADASSEISDTFTYIPGMNYSSLGTPLPRPKGTVGGEGTRSQDCGARNEE